MAKKAAKSARAGKQFETPGGILAALDEALAVVIDDVATKTGKLDNPVSQEDWAEVLPLPSLAIRYALQSEGWTLGRFHQVVGPEGSYKSTFMGEVQRWHRLCGGGGAIMEAETKFNEELLNAMLWHDSQWLRIEKCPSADAWQKMVTFYTDKIKKKMDLVSGPGRRPFCIGVDSLTGKATQGEIDKLMKEGSMGKSWPALAGSLTRYCQTYTQLLAGWPFSFVGVNHMKPSLEEGDITEKIPGGKELAYQSATIVRLEKYAREIKADSTVVRVRLDTIKNSYGPERMPIIVEIRWWKQEDAPGVFRLYGRFEWWAASIYLLQGDFFNKALKEALLPKIGEIIDIREKSGGSYGKLFWSDALGVPSTSAMPAHDLGVLLESNIDILDKLYNVLGVSRRNFFQPAVDFISQFPEYAFYGAQEIKSREVREAQQALGKGRAIVPIKRPPTAEEEG